MGSSRSVGQSATPGSQQQEDISKINDFLPELISQPTSSSTPASQSASKPASLSVHQPEPAEGRQELVVSMYPKTKTLPPPSSLVSRNRLEQNPEKLAFTWAACVVYSRCPKVSRVNKVSKDFQDSEGSQEQGQRGIRPMVFSQCATRSFSNTT